MLGLQKLDSELDNMTKVDKCITKNATKVQTNKLKTFYKAPFSVSDKNVYKTRGDLMTLHVYCVVFKVLF